MASKGSKKCGRGTRSPARKAYVSLHRRDTNKSKKAIKHLAKHPNDNKNTDKVDYKHPTKVDPRIAAQKERDKRWQAYLKGAI